jgi:FkbM family methyltransferase
MPVVDDLIYDVGFHRGEDTAFYLRKGYRVVAFEANPDLVKAGMRRFARELADGQLEIVEGAICDTSEEWVVFYTNPSATVWGTTSAEWVRRNRSPVLSIDVPAVRFREHLRRTGTPYFVKIDVEGADRLCLDALIALNAQPAMLSIESTKTDLSQLRGELDMLGHLGFDKFAAVPQARMGGRLIHTSTRSGEQISYRFEPDASGGFGEDIDRWGSRAEVERQYERIFRRYRRRGDDSLADRALGRIPIMRRMLAGWYDTHACR